MEPIASAGTCWKGRPHRTAAALIADLACIAAVAAASVLVVHEVLTGNLVAGDYVALMGAAMSLQGALTGLASSLRGLAEHRLFLSDVFGFFDVAQKEPEEPSLTAHSAALQGRGVSLEARAVTSTYPTQEEPALREVSLRIEPGQRVAIVGDNGAGKTTLVKILTGLYQPTEGMVYFDGIPLTPERAVAVRSRIAAVFQDFSRYALTLRENIGFGSLERMFDDEALRRAAQDAGIADLIDRLPGGPDGFVGRVFGDVDLAGGEWQRLALARALLRDADVVVLDEPTSALDPKAELDLMERFLQRTKGRTVLMVLHRLGPARLADRILVMKGGRIVEDGPHEALMARRGEYAAMFEAQARWYR